MLVLIAQKKGLGALNATQKKYRSLLSRVTEKIEKNFQKCQLSPKMAIFLGMLVVFLDFLSNGTWQGLVVFCVAFSAPRRFS